MISARAIALVSVLCAALPLPTSAQSPAVGHSAPAEVSREPAAGPAPSLTTQASAAEDPRPTAVDDRLVQPPAAAPRTLRSWQEALAAVRLHTPEYRVQAETVAIARAQARQAVAALLPSLNGQGSYGHQFITEFAVQLRSRTPVANAATLVGSLDWPILNSKNYYTIGTANLNVEFSARSLDEWKREFALDLLGAIVDTLATTRAAELTRLGLKFALERAQLTHKKLQYGQGTTLDVDRAEQDVASARSDVVKGDEALRQAREALGLALGSAVPVAVSDELSLDRFQRSVVETCRLNDTVEERADVMAAHLQLQLASRGITSAMLSFAPWVSLRSQLAFNTPVPYGPRTTWSLEAVLNVPLYDGTRYAQLDQARGLERQARANLDATRLQALVNITQANRAVTVMTDALGIAEQQRVLAQRIDRSTRAAYADGIGTSLDLVTSAQALRQAELNRVLAQFNLVHAEAKAVLAHSDCRF